MLFRSLLGISWPFGEWWVQGGPLREIGLIALVGSGLIAYAVLGLTLKAVEPAELTLLIRHRRKTAPPKTGRP